MNTIIKPNEVQKYLRGKSIAYASGWLACDAGNPHRKVSELEKIQILFDLGYGDRYANNENEPDPEDEDQGYDDDHGYDEYKEKRAGLFEQMGIGDDPDLDFLNTRRENGNT